MRITRSTPSGWRITRIRKYRRTTRMRLFGKGGSNFTSEDTNSGGMEGTLVLSCIDPLTLRGPRTALTILRSHVAVSESESQSISRSDRMGAGGRKGDHQTMALGALSAVNERMPLPSLSPEKPIKNEGRCPPSTVRLFSLQGQARDRELCLVGKFCHG